MASPKKASAGSNCIVNNAKRTSIGHGLRKRGSWNVQRKKPSRGQGKG